MAEEKEKPKRKHLHQIRTEATRDGHYVHHHTYKDHPDAHDTETERKNVAVSSSPEEAGEHVGDQMSMNEAPPQADPGAPSPEAGGEATPAAGGEMG